MARLLLALCALLLLTPVAGAAQAPPATEAADPYEQVYRILEGGYDQTLVIENALRMLTSQMAMNPLIAQVESRTPGTLAALRSAVRPIMLGYSERVRLEFRPRMVDVLRRGLSADDAGEIGAFYATPIGRRLMAQVSASYRPENVLGTIDEGRKVTQADVEGDLGTSAGQALAGLSDSELAQLTTELAARPATARLGPLLPAIAAIRAEAEEAPMTADEERALQAAVETVLRPAAARLSADK